MKPRLHLPILTILLFCSAIRPAKAQTLWGMTPGGGKNIGGNVFSINTDGTGFSEHYAFLADGTGSANQHLLNYGDGFLYGITGLGSTDDRGAIYKMHPDGSAYQLLYFFKRDSGYSPNAALIKGADGLLYGTASQGGKFNAGILFKLNTDGTHFQVVHDFDGTNARFPATQLVQLSDGYLYGATTEGGAYSKGALFKLRPDGSDYQSMHWFNGTNGETPEHLFPVVVGRTTWLYGTTSKGGAYGGGVLFRILPSVSSFSVQYEFTGLYGKPAGIGDVLYGICGTNVPGFDRRAYAFNLLDGTVQTIKLFPLPDAGSTVEAIPLGLIAVNGALYGITQNGGTNHWGVLFKLNVDGSGYQSLLSYSNHPEIATLFTYNNQIYGGTSTTAPTDLGTVYRVNTDGSLFQPLHVFNSPDGFKPTGSLVKAQDGNLYGVAGNNIPNISPIWVFRMKTDGSGFTRLLSLPNWSIGSLGSLLQISDGSFFGMNNGDPFAGNIFKFKQGSSFISYQQFDVFGYAPGMAYNPTGSLIRATDGLLYGMTPLGGTSHLGAIFKMNPAGTGFTLIHSFSTADGANPNGSLIQAPDGFLYGMTETGSTQGWGSIFKMRTDGTSFQVIFRFGAPPAMYSAANGAHPRGSLLWGADGKLYGMATGGGASLSGVIFRLNGDGSAFQVLHSFNNIDGAFPEGSLIQENSSGLLYGMTKQGGVSNVGVIFKMNPDGSGYQKLLDFNGANGRCPIGDLLLVNTSPVAASAKTLTTFTPESDPTADNRLIDISPNPAHDRVHIHWHNNNHASFSGNDPDGSTILLLTDITGKTLKAQRRSLLPGDQYLDWDISSLPAATYLIKMTIAGHQLVKMLVKQ